MSQKHNQSLRQMQSPPGPLPSDGHYHGHESKSSTCRSLIIDKLAIAPLGDEGGSESRCSCRFDTPNENSSSPDRPLSPTGTMSRSLGAPIAPQTDESSVTMPNQAPISPMQSISRTSSWRNMESILADAQPMTRAEPVSSPLRSVARNISWSNMEVFDDMETRPKSTTPTKRADDGRRGRKKTLRQKSSSLSNLTREQNQEKPSRKSPHTLTRPNTQRRTVRPQRSSSLSRLDRPKQLSANTCTGARQAKTVGKSLSLRRKSTFSPTRTKTNIVEDIGPRKRSTETNHDSRSPRRGARDKAENAIQGDRRQSSLRAMVKSLSKRSFRAFSPTKSRQDELDIRPQKKTPTKVKDEERKPRGESPLKAVVRSLSLQRVSSPTKTRGNTLDIRPKDQKKTREASRSPKGNGRKSLGLSLDKHLSLSPYEQTNQNDCYSVASSTIGSRLQRTKSLLSLCSTTETAAVDTSTMAAAAVAVEEVRSCSPDRRNSGFHIRNYDVSSSFRTQSSTAPGSPVRRRSKQPGESLSSSMHSSPHRASIGDTRLSLSQSTHSPKKGIRKQLSLRSNPISPKTDQVARKLSLSPVRTPEILSPKTAAAGLSMSLHGDSNHRRVRGMRHPPKTKHNNLNRSLHGGSVPL